MKTTWRSSALLGALLGTFAAHAQAPVTGALSGRTEDPAGLILPRVSLRVLDTARNIPVETDSDKDGRFLFPQLQPGNYTITARANGIGAEIANLHIHSGERLEVLLKLSVIGPNQEISVTTNPESFQETPTVGTIIGRELIENIPLNGRSLQSLISLAPGVVPNSAQYASLGEFSVNGQRSTTNYFTVDGVGANTGVANGTTALAGGAGYSPGVNVLGSTSSLITADSLEEFRIQTSTFAPEFGRTPGGQVSLVSRAGTNDIHGTVFEYFRNEALDANDWFRNNNKLQRSPLRQNQFGGTVGGPLVHSRLFAFLSYEGLRLTQPQPVVRLSVPNRAARALATGPLKDFANAFPLPSAAIDNSEALLASAPTFDAKAALANNIYLPLSFSNRGNADTGSIRADYSIGRGWSVFGRYAQSYSAQISPDGKTNGTQSAAQKSGTVALLWSAARTANDLRINWTQNLGSYISTFAPVQGAQSIPLDSTLFHPNQLPPEKTTNSFGVSGTAGTGYAGFGVGPSTEMSQKQFNLVDSFSWTAGSHQFKFGGDWRYLLPTYYSGNYLQYVQFTNWQQALQGQTYYVYIATLGGPFHPRSHNISLFAQDTWKASNRLTLTYGTRWELNPAPTERDSKGIPAVSNVDDFGKIALAPAGTKLYPTQYKNFAPRVGFAYRVHDQPNHTLVLRGGTGVFYQIASDQVFLAYDNQTGPFNSSSSLLGAQFPGPDSQYAPPSIGAPVPPYDYISAFDPNLQSPLSLHWNVTAEQGLGRGQTLSLSYVAALGRRLYRTENYTTAGANFNTLFITRSRASSLYNSAQIQYRRTVSRGLQTLLSYTWAHSTDDLSNEYYAVMPNVQNGDRADADADRRHVFTAALDWQVPVRSSGIWHNYTLRDWRVDGTYRAYSGAPINVVYFISNYIPAQRPNLIQGQPLWLYDSKLPGGRQINADAFAVPSGTGNGNVPRNYLRGFGSTQLDLALQRAFPIHDSLSAQFRIEAFNLLNVANFTDPSGSAYTDPISDSGPSFSQSQSTLNRGLGGLNSLYQFGGARSLQAALRLSF